MICAGEMRIIDHGISLRWYGLEGLRLALNRVTGWQRPVKIMVKDDPCGSHVTIRSDRLQSDDPCVIELPPNYRDVSFEDARFLLINALRTELLKTQTVIVWNA